MITKAAETPAQAHCPYCHPNEEGKIAILEAANGWLVIDPESSRLISREDWDYRYDGPSGYSESSHINYCYMCGRQLNGE
jgi:hypothetical protein